MPTNFEKYASEGNRFMRELSIALDCQDDKDKAARILKAVLHTFRDHITQEESLQLLAQLPMFLKAIYVEGWSSKEKRKIKHVEEFLLEIWKNDRMLAEEDFGNGQETLDDIITVISLLRTYISDGEMKNIAAVLPSELKPLFERKFSL